MTDERLEELIGAWMQASVATEPDARESATAILERLDDEGSSARWLPRRGGTLAPYLQAAAAVTLVALAGALLWLALGPSEPAPDRLQNVLVGASQSPGPTADAADPADLADPAGPPIHWQTDEVDLYAEGMILRIGDEVYTGQGASFWVEGDGDGDGGARLSVAWDEGGQEHDLELDFGTDGEDWWVDSVRHERPDVYGPDGARYVGMTWFEGDDDRLPLGQAATRDLQVSGTTRMPTCQPLVSHELDVTLEFSGLDLIVRPRDRSPLEDLADRLLGPRSPVGRALDPPPEPQARYVELECPAPKTVSVEIGGLDLLAEPVGTGAWRVLSDSIHDLDETIVDVAVSPDGSTVAATMDRLLWLGSDAQPVSTTTHVPWPNRVDIAPSGDLFIRGGERQYRKDVLVALDGGQLTRLPGYGRSDSRGSGSEDIYDPSWDAEGTLWVGVSGGVGALVDGAWDYRSRYEYSPLAASTAAVSYGAARSLATAPDGDVWIGSGPTFAQYRDGRWIEHDPLRGVVESLDGADGDALVATPLDLKIDESGTMWGLTKLAVGGLMADATVLVRRIGDEWTVYPFDSVAPGEGLESQHIAVHDGAVVVLVGGSSREPGTEPSEPRLLSFDGLTTTELARLPAGLGYRIADVGPDGTVWIVGGSAEGRYADRLHVVAPQAEPADE